MKRYLNILIMMMLAGAWTAEAATEISPYDIPYTITAPGSYRLSGEVAFGGASNAINVAASHVTLDLNGFTLTGPGGSAAYAVYQAPAAHNLRVCNGTIESWQGVNAVGLYLTGDNNTVEDVRVRLCTSGIRLGDNASVRRTQVFRCSSGFTGAGIEAGENCIISMVQVYSNRASVAVSGIEVDSGSRIEYSTVGALASQTARGILANGQATVQGSVIYDIRGQTGADGLYLAAGGSVEQCAVQGVTVSSSLGGSHGIYVDNASVVLNTTVMNCGGSSTNGAAIYANRRSRIEHCAIYSNNYSGIELNQYNTAAENISGQNGSGADGAAGIEILGDGNRVHDNHLLNNHYGIRSSGTNNLIFRNSLHANTQAGFNNIDNDSASTLNNPGADFSALVSPIYWHNLVW